MALPIEDYALIGDTHTAALVGRDGSIDWLCFPRFDSPSVLGAILGTREHGRWLLAPVDQGATAERSYIGGSVVLVTRWTTATGVAEVTDLMPLVGRRADVIRRVTGISGTVEFTQELTVRFDYATAMPWMRQVGTDEMPALLAVAGPDAIVVRGPAFEAANHSHRASVTVAAGESVDTVMTWYPSHRDTPEPIDVGARIDETLRVWADWTDNVVDDGNYSEAVHRSLILLRALTHEDTGGIVAAATTSLPEEIGGERNWDYRYVWLRDASMTLSALLVHGFRREATDWRQWLLRAIAGDPNDIQIMYGLSGERRLDETELPSLPGYRGSTPVRVGNGAFTQYQGDIFGEVMAALHDARVSGVAETDDSWALQRALLGFVEDNWDRADRGIWEIRGPEQHFTHSRVMLWAALNYGVRAVREFGLTGPAERWEELRDKIGAEIEEKGFDSERGTYTQHYGSDAVDASLLVLPHVGYVAYDDERMLGTVAAIEDELLRDGLLLRYRTDTGVDGLAGDEHPFLACSFWLVQQYASSGRLDDARTLMDRLLSFRNDVGMLSEEYDVKAGRQVGNTPQALSHLSLVQAADAIARAAKQEG